MKDDPELARKLNVTGDDLVLLELSNRALALLKDLERGGVSEDAAITAMQNACTLRVARSRGAAGAAAWLRRIAQQTEANAAAIDRVAAQVH